MARKSPDSRIKKTPAPTVRLAATTAMLQQKGQAARRYPFHLGHDDGYPLLEPALLVSYYFLHYFEVSRYRYKFRDYVLDSGAYSAYQSGAVIDLERFIDDALRLQETDPLLTEIFALDVIGDYRASIKNFERMIAAGVRCIPTYHYGEPESVLLELAASSDKIALGGSVGKGDKVGWAAQCFERVYPKKIHGFGYGSEKAVMALPFHSVDATSWELGATQYGNWQSFGALSVRGSAQNLRPEIEFYLELEKRARIRWAGEMRSICT